MSKTVCFVNEAEIYLFVDRELSSNRQLALNDHLAFCDECAIRFDIARGIRNLLQASCRKIRAPYGLRQQIIDRIDDKALTPGPPFWEYARTIFMGRPLLPIGMAALLVVSLISVILLRPTSSNTMELVSAMVSEHDEYLVSFKTDRGIVSSDLQEVSQWISANTHAEINLSTCGKLPSLAGVCAIKERGKDITCLFFDQGEKRISLFMIPDDAGNPPPGKPIILKGRSLFCGNCTGNNYVMWADKGVVCILVSKLPEESLIKIAENLI